MREENVMNTSSVKVYSSSAIVAVLNPSFPSIMDTVDDEASNHPADGTQCMSLLSDALFVLCRTSLGQRCRPSAIYLPSSSSRPSK